VSADDGCPRPPRSGNGRTPRRAITEYRSRAARTASGGLAPETNGVVERFNQSLKYEHLYREEIATVIGLAEHVEAYRELYNWVRPHEAIGLLAPMVRYLAEPLPAPPKANLCEPQSVQLS
jgi:transposase InsO family protein